MSHQYSRTEAQYDYCGEKLNRHNIKAHTDSKHKGLPVKERFKRQSTLADFVTTGPKKAKLTEPAVTLEEEDDASAAPVEEVQDESSKSDDLKVILEHTTKILEGIDEIKQMKTENKIESKAEKENTALKMSSFMSWIKLVTILAAKWLAGLSAQPAS